MSKAVWIRADDLSPDSRLYRFSHRLTLPAGACLSARVSADSRYRLSVNGRFVVEGPCHGTQSERHYETVDLTPYLCEGENVLSVDVLHVTDGVWISLFRERYPALWFDGALTLPDGSETPVVSSAQSWTCERYENKRFREFPGFIRSIPPVETQRGPDRFAPIPVVDFEDGRPENRCFNEYGVRATYPLTPRPIPHLTPDAPRPMIRLCGDARSAEYDAGRYECAYIRLRVRAAAGTTLRVIAAECKARYDENGRAHKTLRDDPDGEIRGPFDTLIFTESGEMTFSPFYWRAFRYLRLVADADFEVTDLTFSPYYYPMGDEGRVTCSDPAFEKMWEISRHTVMACAHDNYVDCPFYEQQQYDMDSGLQMLFTLRMTADAALPRKSLSDLAASQLPDGMIQANYPSVVVQVIPSFSLFWVLMLRDYLRYTGDLAFIKKMLGTAEKVMTAFENLLDERGLVGPSVYWPFLDWAPEWGSTGTPDGSTTEPLIAYTFLYAYTLRAAADLCRAVGRRGQAEDYLARAQAANAAGLAYGFDRAKGLFRNTPERAEFAQHPVLWAVLSGAVTGERAREMMRRVMTEPVSKCTFSMNHYLFRALERTDLYDEFAPSVFEGWKTMLDWHCTTWCENPDDPRSECHGWSSAPLYEMSAALLGVRPTEDGYRCATVAPRCGWFDEMSGSVPTPYGLILVEWHKEGAKTILSVTNPSPQEIKLTVKAGGKETVQKATKVTYTL
ncbi:MAG: hypothetical protein J6125_03165 [Clostridia bacterium]|nr:hypothetical protein [Clostridia bacterium]